MSLLSLLLLLVVVLLGAGGGGGVCCRRDSCSFFVAVATWFLLQATLDWEALGGDGDFKNFARNHKNES